MHICRVKPLCRANITDAKTLRKVGGFIPSPTNRNALLYDAYVDTMHGAYRAYRPRVLSRAVMVPKEAGIIDSRTWNTDPSTTVFLIGCMSTALAAISRTSFSVLAIPIQSQLGLSLSEMGLVQSSLLLGYVVGQLPAGFLADSMGGTRTLVCGLLVWSVFGACISALPMLPLPVLSLISLRIGLGLGQSVLMPGVSALAAQSFVDPVDRSDKTSRIYGCYNFGTVFSLLITPALAEALGWTGACGLFGVVGLTFGIMSLFVLEHDRSAQRNILDRECGTYGQKSGRSSQFRRKSLYGRLCRHGPDLLLLCWTHAVIGFGFFVLQAWVPTFLHSLGTENLKTLGVLSSFPWLLTALAATGSGSLAQYLQTGLRWNVNNIRKFMQTLSSLGGAISLAPLAIQSSSISPMVATCSLSLAVGFLGFCYAGFHAYVQDVANKDAGLVLAVTNTCSIAAGIAGNLIAGTMASSHGFSGVFALSCILYLLSCITWLSFAKGKKFRLVV